MTAGGVLIVAAIMLPRICLPDVPHAVSVTANILFLASLPLITIGSCIYARGTGYPFWLGLFGITLVGLLILMLLPDQYPDPPETD